MELPQFALAMKFPERVVVVVVFVLVSVFQSYVYEIMREWGTRFDLPLLF